MLKIQGVVIKNLILIIVSILSLSCNKNAIRDSDYVLLDKVIELTNNHQNNDVYKLVEKVNSDKSKLKNYYDLKYLEKSIGKIVFVESDTIIYASDERQKERDSITLLQYKVLDSLFTRKDIETILKQNDEFIWSIDKINSKVIFSNGNQICKPYYSLDGKYAIVQHSSLKTFTSFYVFEKIQESWNYIDVISNLW